MSKQWNDMTDDEKRKLIVYEKYLKRDMLTDLEKQESLSLTKYCIENDLCVTEIPNVES